jgi:23S rRNA (cytidine1920-2'-O)/16S rRNA (cytidine1409-2'-O)-methyltransferase
MSITKEDVPNSYQNLTFAGRAGAKLAFALDHFQIKVAGLVCADFGSAVGGFVDCLIQAGAAKVYAVETGYGVLAWKLRQDPRVVVKERTNAMHVELPVQVDLITIDTSWTKQLTILPNALSNTKSKGQIITLIKPHYEVDKRFLIKGKVEEEMAAEVAEKVAEDIRQTLPLEVLGLAPSPVLGGKAENREFVAWLQKTE